MPIIGGKMKFLFLIILLSFKGAFAQSEILCDLNPTFFCSFDIEQYFKSPPEDEDSLHHLCGLFTKYFRCMRTFASRCHKSDEYRPYKYLSSARDFVTDLCFEGGFLHQDYLRYAKCYKNAMPEIRNCQDFFHTGYESYFAHYEVTDSQLREDICKDHRENVVCISEEIQRMCGTEAKLVFLQMVQDSKYLQVTCPDYNEGN